MSTLSCESARQRLDEYLDGELPEDEQAEIAGHVADCSACTADALQRTHLRIAIKAAGHRFTATPELRSRITGALGEFAAQKVNGKAEEDSGRRYGQRRQWSEMLPLAAALLVGMLGGYLARSSALPTAAGREAEMERFSDLHATLLASSSPVEVVSTDRHTVKPWFQGRIPFSFVLPELDGTAFSLRGGRVVYIGGSQAAYLLFDLRQHHVGVFVLAADLAHETTAAPPASRPPSRRGIQAETWSAGGLRYVAVGDANAADLSALHRLIAGAG